MQSSPPPPKVVLAELLQRLGFSAQIEEVPQDDGLTLNILTDDSDRLIGRQGQTLSDLQYLLNRLVFEHETAGTSRVMVDVAGYRAANRDALVRKAKEAAEKVRRWGDLIELEPLNAYERRIVHQALRDDPDVETFSVEVEGSIKKAVVLRPRTR